MIYTPFCASCWRDFRNGEMVFFRGDGHYICQKCSEKENSKCGDCIHFQPAWLCRKIRNTGGENSPVNDCPDFERENMVQTKLLKITAEVDGKIIPLNTISTETFEAIKALEKPKEIPVARVGHYIDEPDDRRLFLKITDNIRQNVVKTDIDVIAINLQHGVVNNTWLEGNDVENINKLYENVTPL